MTFEIIEERDSIVAMALHGRLSGMDVAPPADPIRHHIGADCYSRRLLLDFSDVPYLDSMGVSWLITCNRRFRDGGGRLILHSMHPAAMSIIRVLKLESILTIVPDADSALKAACEEDC
jgi:anti-anti-sigma factor